VKEGQQQRRYEGDERRGRNVKLLRRRKKVLLWRNP